MYRIFSKLQQIMYTIGINLRRIALHFQYDNYMLYQKLISLLPKNEDFHRNIKI